NAEGKDDIYSFRKLSPLFFVKVDVHMKGTDTPIPNASVDITNSRTGNKTTMVADNNGDFLFPADSLTGYAFTSHKDGYFTSFGAVNTPGFQGKFNDTSRVVIDMEQIVINKCVRIENILYDYNKWNIRPESALELDKLVKLMMDNPGIKVELGSHTDSRGSDSYNLKLSVKRAQAAVDYIVSKGISRDRITAKGYGEQVPLNKCKNGVKCTEEEYQYNRRTEFKVTSCVPQQ
ncbi:MAG TPA: OmpA family protein, partial [Bacteroidia bacterium]|nr:OmpA family protein [Bacteroidia bacterium]